MRIVLATILVLLSVPSALAQTYLYSAVCENSYSKQGEQSADLTKQPGNAIRCDSVVLGFLKNGNILVQFAERASRVTPLGFAGSRIDYEMDPGMATLPLERVYLPHTSNPGRPQVMSGIEGFCFLSGKINVRSLTNVGCSSKIEIGTQKLIYNMNAKITSIGQVIPGN